MRRAGEERGRFDYGGSRANDRAGAQGVPRPLIRPGIALKRGGSRMPLRFSPAQAATFREESRIADMGLLVLCEFGPSHGTGDGRKARTANRVVCPVFVSPM
jgi:hypothetical protein